MADDGGVRSGVVTLLGLLHYYADFFIETFAYLNAMEGLACDAPEGQTYLPEIACSVYAKIGVLRGHCEMYSFESVSSQCARIVSVLEARRMQITPNELRGLLADLRQRCQDEIGARFFLVLTPDQARQYDDPMKDWESVVGRFHKVRYNVEESAKCHALERYGSCVFHILLVAEYGVIQLADLMQVKAGHPGWGQVASLQNLIKEPWPKRSPLAQKHSRLLEAVVPLLYQVKESWRHKISHVDSQLVWVDTDFSPQVADEIVKATRGFMRKLATDLPR